MYNDFEIEKVGVDGHVYTHANNSKIGWRMGDDEGCHMAMTTCDYYLTDGVSVLRCEGIAIWEEEEELVEAAWHEWHEYIDAGEEFGITKIV